MSHHQTLSSSSSTNTPRRQLRFVQLEQSQQQQQQQQQQPTTTATNQFRIINLPIGRRNITESNNSTSSSSSILFPGPTTLLTTANSNNNNNNNNNNTPHSPASAYGGIQNMFLAQNNAPPFLENVIVIVNSTDPYWDNARRNDVVKCCKNLGAKIMKAKSLLSQNTVDAASSIVLFITMYKYGDEYEKVIILQYTLVQLIDSLDITQWRKECFYNIAPLFEFSY
jgi:hypothetical protein